MQELTPHDHPRSEREMQLAHQAAHQLFHSMASWDASDRMALVMVLLTALNGLDHPEDEEYVAHSREVIFDILDAIPGLVEKAE